MKLNKFSLVGYIFGAIVIILSIYRWWFLFYDPSTMLIYVAGGCCAFGFAYLYDSLKKKDEKIKESNLERKEQIDDLKKDIQSIQKRYAEYVEPKLMGLNKK